MSATREELLRERAPLVLQGYYGGRSPQQEQRLREINAQLHVLNSAPDRVFRNGFERRQYESVADAMAKRAKT